MSVISSVPNTNVFVVLPQCVCKDIMYYVFTAMLYLLAGDHEPDGSLIHSLVHSRHDSYDSLNFCSVCQRFTWIANNAWRPKLHSQHTTKILCYPKSHNGLEWNRANCTRRKKYPEPSQPSTPYHVSHGLQPLVGKIKLQDTSWCHLLYSSMAMELKR